jgi:hypothetical protein
LLRWWFATGKPEVVGIFKEVVSMETMAKVLAVVVAGGVLGFFAGSMMGNEIVYTLSACVAAWAGLALAILKEKRKRAA